MTTRPARLGSLNEFCWFDLKTRDPAGTAAFFSKSLGWRFAVDEEDWRKAVKISVDDHPIGGVSDLANPVYPPETPAHLAFTWPSTTWTVAPRRRRRTAPASWYLPSTRATRAAWRH
jgi:predicted enzyme related to lactoylglutathione lyase